MKFTTDKIHQLNLNFSISTLVNNYTHLGFKKTHLHHGFRRAVLGYYNNITIINPKTTLLHLKFMASAFLTLQSLELKFCIVSFNTPPVQQQLFDLRGNYYFFNNWLSGLITNSDCVLVSKKIIQRENFCPYVPDFLILMDMEVETLNSINREAIIYELPSFSFVDSRMDLSPFNYWIPMNLKSSVAKIFLIKFLNTLIEKSEIFKRLDFVKDLNEFKQWIPYLKARRLI